MHKLKLKTVRFATVGEPWCEYQCESGKTIRVKFVLTHAFETEQIGPDGKPLYTFNGQPIFAVDEAEEK